MTTSTEGKTDPELKRWRWVDCRPHQGYFEVHPDGPWASYGEAIAREAELRKDAERLDWLRNHWHHIEAHTCSGNHALVMHAIDAFSPQKSAYLADTFNAAIDGQIAKEKG